MIEQRATRGRCAVADRRLPAGSPVPRFSGLPYACCPLPSQRERVCGRCFAQAPAAPGCLLRCSKCRWARYCSRECQAGDWQRHKRECRTLASKGGELLRLDDAPVADLLLLGRCAWRRHDASSPDDEDAAFDALETSRPTESDRALARFATTLPGLLPPSCDAGDATRLLSQFRVNNFGVTNELLSVVGAGCYPPAALLNHSCAPNAVLYYEGSRLEVRTCRDVDAGEELCHSRAAQLRERYGFECACVRCSGGRRSDEWRQDVDAAMEAPHPSLGEADCADVAAATAAAHAVWYEAEGRCLSAALLCGDNAAALECCRALVSFLEAALAHVPAHALLALQRFTLCDLELESGDAAEARRQMEACAEAVAISYGAKSALRAAARERWEELMSGGS
ncbi:hypothetical protein EMIHUDRAFT_194541 [Emiliania huxleyi CCMP1516]|uniref:MYND-type domain-containing protein n=2 Tax=Emiliania huxleyi TaxID=2903 RepID=A0A0D3L1Q3_EMIH1|nr:hypothetical protein EMIHUDRAFT_194541 [Emiliania huxleyi CCMP1516]EOD41938.1 hypothetical protein EMIHUDRAFT_194541 [Emiliania huxleyi CCMP1516]|eukprot:XP_005794367.1 hypothetical protein EMIHUDRAFT_194541 [Emiliania huxleyi CCMP1516]